MPPLSMTALEQSYAWCQRVARTRAKNFYYSFILLSPEQKNAMCAVYAFMRYCDDLSDEPGASAAPIDRWRAALANALQGHFDGHPVWPAFHDTVVRFGIPHQYFFDMIAGVRSDLNPRLIETFDELYLYCYQVASVAGMATIHIFGFDSPKALPLAEKCGIAFQLTNIIRDVREDAERGRVYLPAEDLAQFHVAPDYLQTGGRSKEFVTLMGFEGARARAYYNESQPLLNLIHARSRASLWTLIEIYSRLLDRIHASNYDVLARRISLPAWQKAGIVIQALAGRITRAPAASATRSRTARP
ncbi:MAG: phytoene/squalene synthase family protein [Acidobacteriota bacterium]|nr:phytoene/squalene synthase family protein [Acidobacteriota bacterium]